jgi:poly-gamma-glutamate synthesis protein (capsule biosynthesis protein)
VSGRRLALIALGGLAVAGTFALWPASRPEVRLLFTGDILLSRQVAVEMERTGKSPLDSVAPLFRKADWVAGNFEGAIGTRSRCRTADTTLCFAFPDTAPAMLARAGLSAVSIANNHAGDLGADGRVRSRDALRSAGVLALDFEHSPRFVRFGDITVAAIAISLVPGADGEVQAVPSVALAQKLRLARSLASLVVVSVHWGTELQDWPDQAQQAAAEWLVDHGADLVIGHHPHVVQQPGCVHGRPVFYSLGNLVFDQRYPETNTGLVADCTIRGGRLRCGGIQTHALPGSARPVLSGIVNEPALSRCSASLSPPLTVSGYTLRPEPWSPSGTEDGLVIEGWRDRTIRWRSRRVDAVALQPGLTDTGGGQLVLALERHPSSMDGQNGIRPHVYAVDGQGLVARWRGTALAWPLVDAVVDADGRLCALHRGDSFIRPDPTTVSTRTMLYRWNGFGFSAVDDSAESSSCAASMHAIMTRLSATPIMFGT